MSETAVTLSTIIIFTHDMQRLAAFYRQGLQLAEPQPTGPDHLGWPLANLYFGFDQIDVNQQHPGGVTPWFEVPNLDEAYSRFLAAGASVRYEPTRKPWGGYLASLYDLDGNIFGLSEAQT